MYRKFLSLLLLLLSVLSTSAIVSAQDNTDLCATDEVADVAPSRSVRALMLLNSLQTGDTTTIEAYVNPDTYIQHNLSIPDGRDALIDALSVVSADPAAVFIPHRVIENGNLVAIHSEYNLSIFGGALTGFDIFRFDDNGLIVEHWDNLQPVVAPNPSGRTAIDGALEITDLDKTTANCEHVVEFVTAALIEGRADLDFTQYISADTYLQHNTSFADGLDGLFTAFGALAEANQVLSYNSIELVVAQGNFVLTASDGLGGDADNPTPTAYFDLFRLEDGLIVEHWDVIQTIPPASEWQNENGKF
jgi:predicted SnoaL-like aldol condensation-catalyzing enzyme